MMKTRMILFFMLLVAGTFTAGCYPAISLNPFYTDKDVIFDDDLLGFWLTEESNDTWRIKKAGKNKYRVNISFEENSMLCTGHLFKIQDTLYLDLFPDVDISHYLTIPVHTIIRVEKTGSKLELAELDSDWLAEYLEDNPGATAFGWYTQPEDQSVFFPVLTSSTKDLQDFIGKIQDIEGAFQVVSTLYRKSEK